MLLRGKFAGCCLVHSYLDSRSELERGSTRMGSIMGTEGLQVPLLMTQLPFLPAGTCTATYALPGGQ